MRDSKGAYRVLVVKPEQKNHLQDPGIHGNVTLKWICKKYGDLAPDTDKLWALVNMVMGHWVA
jgi:hypothetical protein